MDDRFTFPKTHSLFRRLKRQKNMKKHLPLAILLSLQVASAATITLSSTNFGFARPTGARTVGNHAIGWYSGENVEIRQYLVFDRSSINGTITAATLRLQSSATSFASPDPAETWQLFDVLTPTATLLAGTGGAAAFADLGTGTSLASRSVNGATNNTVLTLDLNSDGLTYLNNQTGTFAIGGALTTLTKTPGISERMFNSSNVPSFTRELFITYTPASESAVPEPSTCLLFAAGLFTLVATRKRT
jgi:hypothetical protein